MFVVDPDFQPHAAAIRQSLPLMRLVALKGAPAGWFAWDGPMPTGFEPKLPGVDADPVMIVYTSGTTGKPKGAVHTQAGVLWNIVNATLYQDLTSRDHVLTVLPMFHVGGLCIQTLPALHAGATVTIHPRFDAGAFLRDVAARRPTLTLLVPATLTGGVLASRLGADRPLEPAGGPHRLVEDPGFALRAVPRARHPGRAGVRRDRDRAGVDLSPRRGRDAEERLGRQAGGARGDPARRRRGPRRCRPAKSARS